MLTRCLQAAKSGYLFVCLFSLFALAACGGGGGGGNSAPAGPKATSIEVAPATASIANGTTQPFSATALFDDGSKQDVTTLVTWASDTPAVATVSNTSPSNGLATSVSTGTANISASYTDPVSKASLSGSASLTVTPAVITGLALTPTSVSLAKGTSAPFKATATFSDGTHQDVTSSASLSTADPTIATVSSTGVVQAIAIGSTSLNASYMGQTATPAVITVTAATLTSLAVSPITVSLPLGSTQQFVATGTYSDGSQQDLSSTVTWTSSSPSVATISATGLAQSNAQGGTTITAASGADSAMASVTVTAVALESISITPSNPSVPKATNQQFTATGIYSDQSTQNLTSSVVWSSSATNIATISNATGSAGLAAALATGTTTITATSGSGASAVSGTTVMNVSGASLTSISVTPANKTLPAGYSLQYVATGTYSDQSTADISTQVTWSSSQTTATISNASGSNGLATGVSKGVTTISAALNGLAGSTNLTISSETLSSVSVTPSTASLPNGRSLQYTATGTFSSNTTLDLSRQVAWTSSNTALATINSSGLATAVAASGSVTISATSGSGASAVTGTATLTLTNADLLSIMVAPTSVSVSKGLTQAFTAQGQFSDGTSMDVTTAVTWVSSDTTIATISNDSGAKTNGLASTVGTGTATITANAKNAAGAAVTGTGSLTVTAAALTSITVTPATPTVALGQTQQFTATGTYTDGTTPDLTTQVTWSSSDQTVATISNAAKSQGLASTGGASGNAGTSTISAALSGVSGTATLTVTAAKLASIAVTPANASLAKSSQLQFAAKGTDTNGNVTDLTTQVTWSSSDTSIADIDNASNKGQALGKATGKVTITATDPASSIAGSTSLTITPPTLQSIAISITAGGSASSMPYLLPNTYSEQFYATGIYSDGSTADITSQVTWATLTPNVLKLQTTAGTNGLFTGVATGNATITATSAAISSNHAVTVDSETLTVLTVGPPNATISGSGNTLQFTATGAFSDGTTLDLTDQVTWASSSTSVATISSTGLATAGTALPVVKRTTTISAANAGLTGTDTLTLTN